jgi:hypothetical protein
MCCWRSGARAWLMARQTGESGEMDLRLGQVESSSDQQAPTIDYHFSTQ